MADICKFRITPSLASKYLKECYSPETCTRVQVERIESEEDPQVHMYNKGKLIKTISICKFKSWVYSKCYA